jgi:hypothetical protein
MTEPLNSSIKEISDKYENFSIEIHNLVKFQELSLAEIKAQIIIIKSLVETAVQLDDVRNDDVELTIHIFIEQKSVTVEVRKQVSLSSYVMLEELDKAIQWIRGYQSPLDPYITELKEISSKSQKSQTIAHGLAKLAYETEAVLDFYVTENSILNLSSIRYFHGETREVND